MSEITLIISLCLILLTLFVVLVERKFLAYAQRRMGPATMGRNGYLQIILDLIKLITKETFLIPRPTTAAAPIFLALLYSSQLVFIQNMIFAPNSFLNQSPDSLLLYHIIFILLANIFFSLVGLISQSRYALLGIIRALLHAISLDIFITLLYVLLVYVTQSVHFADFVVGQNAIWYGILFLPLSSSFLLLLLLESKRSPFDHAETESEVVAGYAVEYSSTMLLMFYLVEYLHLIIAAVHTILFFLGGWLCLTLLQLIGPFVYIIHDTTFLFLIFGF